MLNLEHSFNLGQFCSFVTKRFSWVLNGSMAEGNSLFIGLRPKVLSFKPLAW